MPGYVAAAVQTPWGKIDELRDQQLRPGPGRSREAVVENQRHRLFAAMVGCTATKGYGATTVADLIEVAGVSRATFYEHFRDKADCFRAANEFLLDAGLSLLRQSIEGSEAPHESVERALETFLRLTASQPAAARMSLVESYSAGEAGLEPVNKAFEQACELAHEALRQLPGREHTPAELARAVIGGLHRVLYHRLYQGEEDNLPRCCQELWRWATGYDPPKALPKRRVPRLDGVAQSAFLGRDLHEKIIRAFATAVARHGYLRVTVPKIAAEAGISNATFYQHFENKEDALLAALDLSGAQLIAATLPAARRAPTWPRAIGRALEGLCDFLAAEPAFAKMRGVEVYSAGPEAIAHRDRAWEQIVAELMPADVRIGDEPGPLAIEASSGAIYALIYEKVRRDKLGDLRELPPLLTYIMVAPFLGPEEAGSAAA